MESVVGYIMAWRPEGAEQYNFEFFAETSSSGERCKYYYRPFSNEQNNKKFISHFLEAKDRAEYELALLKEGKIKKYGTNVVDGYVMPVIDNIQWS